MPKIAFIFKKYWPIILIVFLALFLRLFRISSYMTFLGDEGRDALVWLRMAHGKFTLIGPTTSIGNMYLGPLYYYLMFPFYLLLGTAGPSAGVAFFGGATAFLLWCFGREWFNDKTGLIAAFLYAVSPVAIILSRSSWNPNVMPFFALLSVWGIWQFWRKENYLWLVVEGVLLSFAVQSHYLGLLLIPVPSLFWIASLLKIIKNENKKLKGFLVYTGLAVLSFLLLTVLPLVWFDLRHNFINYHSFYKFFSERQTTVNFKPYKAIPQIWPLWQMLVTRLLAGKNIIVGLWTSIVLGVGLIINIVSWFRGSNKERGDKQAKSFLLIFTWLSVGLLGMGLYKQHIYDHYFGFLFPAVFLLAARMVQKIGGWGKAGRWLFWTVLLVLVFFSLKEVPLRHLPNSQLKHAAMVDEKIIEEAGGKPFNLGLIAKQNYDAGYRYLLEKAGHKALEIDPQKSKETVAGQLFVVCEESVCEPTTHPQTEIANFGWSKVEKEWDFPWGVKLFKLVPWQ